MPLGSIRLRAWALSTDIEGARSPANCEFLNGLLGRGCLEAKAEVTISPDRTEEQGVPCVRLSFQIPQGSQSNAITAISVLVPRAFVGTNMLVIQFIFYALVEELIGWLAGVGPKNSLIRLYHNSNGRQHPRSYSSSWHRLHSGFTLLITNLRDDKILFPGLGQFSSAFGVIKVAHARTAPGQVTSDFAVSITLNNKQQITILLPCNIAKLPKDLVLDWLEIRNEFSS